MSMTPEQLETFKAEQAAKQEVYAAKRRDRTNAVQERAEEIYGKGIASK